MIAVKYEVKLDDGTIIAKSSDLGVQFYVRDGKPPFMTPRFIHAYTCLFHIAN